jgi:hypothetical protein
LLNEMRKIPTSRKHGNKNQQDEGDGYSPANTPESR